MSTALVIEEAIVMKRMTDLWSPFAIHQREGVVHNAIDVIKDCMEIVENLQLNGQRLVGSDKRQVVMQVLRNIVDKSRASFPTSVVAVLDVLVIMPATLSRLIDTICDASLGLLKINNSKIKENVTNQNTSKIFCGLL